MARKGPPTKGKTMTGKHAKMGAGCSDMGAMDSELSRGLKVARAPKAPRVSTKRID